MVRLPLGGLLLGVLHAGSVGWVLLGAAVASAPSGDVGLVLFALTVYLGLFPLVQVGYAVAAGAVLVLAEEWWMALGVALGSGATLGLGGVVVAYQMWWLSNHFHP